MREKGLLCSVETCLLLCSELGFVEFLESGLKNHNHSYFWVAYGGSGQMLSVFIHVALECIIPLLKWGKLILREVP